MTQPDDFVDSKYVVEICKLKRSIYGLKELKSSFRWIGGFIKNDEEACVYRKESVNSLVFMILYVDDISLTRYDVNFHNTIKESLKLVYILGMNNLSW